MRRVLTTTDESHPDTPESLDLGAFSECDTLVWQVYIDGTPFLGVPFTRDADDVERAASEARAHRDRIIATGRYEYVDLRLRPDRRSEDDRRLAPREGDQGRRWEPAARVMAS